MSARLEGKVAFVTGAARGQGRSHAIRLAQEGADIITLDLCEQVDTVGYPMSSPEDLAETVAAIEALDRRIVAHVGDVREPAALAAVVREGMDTLGRLDVLVINHGIAGVVGVEDATVDQWKNMIDINLTGVWNTLQAAVPAMLSAGNRGSIIMTSSYAGAQGVPNVGPYSAAKHGVVGLMRSMANELGPKGIRVNTINPGNVGTGMLLNDELYSLFRPDLEHPGEADVTDTLLSLPAMPVPYVEAIDISNAVLFLASEESRFITGIQLPVDAGWAIKPM